MSNIAEEKKIKSLILRFPHGATPEQCQYIAGKVQGVVDARISEGGYTMTFMPMTVEEESLRGCEFEEDEMTYTFGYRGDGKHE